MIKIIIIIVNNSNIVRSNPLEPMTISLSLIKTDAIAELVRLSLSKTVRKTI